MIIKVVLSVLAQIAIKLNLDTHKIDINRERLAKHHLYEGPPQPCTVFQTFQNGRNCIAFRSLVTGKDHVFPPHYSTVGVRDLFLAYGYSNAQETLDSKIKLVAM